MMCPVTAVDIAERNERSRVLLQQQSAGGSILSMPLVQTATSAHRIGSKFSRFCSNPPGGSIRSRKTQTPLRL
jgi:hypothetical protein